MAVFLKTAITMYLVFLSLFLASCFTEIPLRKKMENLTWKNRVIVIYTPEADSEEFRQQKQLLATKTTALEERDLVVIECVGNKLSAEDRNYVARHFAHDLTGFGVWLVGKDGGTKLTESRPVPTEKFFSLIDSMPMRQAEMKRRGE